MNLVELEPNQFEKIRSLFHKLQHLTFTLDAVIARNTLMRIWVDSKDDPKSCFMWDKMHCYYFVGQAENENFNKQISKLFDQTIIPQAIRNKSDLYKVESSSKEWEPFLEKLLKKYLPVKRSRVFLTLEEFIPKNMAKFLQKAFEIREIDQKLLESEIANIQSIVDEINVCWDSIESFLKIGFGFCLIVHLDNSKKEIQGWCTGEYFSSKKCGIGIETFSGYRKKGYATAMASAFVEHCLKTNIKPYWDSYSNNYASIRVAEKIGFKKIEDYHVYFGSFINSELYQGYHYFSEKKYEIAAKWFEKAAELEQRKTESLYNAACSWSLGGESEKAFLQLHETIDSLNSSTIKFINYMRKDRYLEALHSLDNWKKILTQLSEIESRIKEN